MHTVHLSGDAVHVMQRQCKPPRHDHSATVQRWAFACDEPDGVLRNASSGMSTLTRIRRLLQNT
ncbi:hypothetical protein [Synechococcus sp. BIOS-E4-1]|uniref:hypothetical protein n=1 Tax=Synechococcus sp. BIOS-E4-1 TaxID=1400864 RepID=UPI0016495223|nr:hypothetical protein [Synechococcus sp. BIOS-E4-1]